MSAFICCDYHIASVCMTADYFGFFNRSWVKDLLQEEQNRDIAPFSWEFKPWEWKAMQVIKKENMRSYDWRYREETKFEPCESGRYRILTPVELLKAIDCLIYQSCESPDWENTDAVNLLRAIYNFIITKLPGYDEADWEVRSKTTEEV